MGGTISLGLHIGVHEAEVRLHAVFAPSELRLPWLKKALDQGSSRAHACANLQTPRVRALAESVTHTCPCTETPKAAPHSAPAIHYLRALARDRE